MSFVPGSTIPPPSFLEILASEKMTELMGPVFFQCIENIPFLDLYRKEAWLMVSSLIEIYFGAYHNSSFSEYFYKLERAPLHPNLKPLGFSVLWGPTYHYFRQKFLSYKNNTLEFIVVIGDLLRTIFSLLYLLKLSPYYYPWLCIHKLVLKRKISPNQESYKYLSIETLVTIFPVALFMARIGQWWRDNGFSNINLLVEDRFRSDQKLNGVDPPSVLSPHETSSLPSRGQCAICKQQPHKDPTSLPSGYVFCYICILCYIKKEGKCPITLVPYDESHLRKIFF